METIAPLAKVLAEANGIEWQTLRGTGQEGLITEQDILGYLARVMSGEEDAPLTPVDPEPSPAELAAYSSPEMLSRAGVEADLTDFMKLHTAQVAAAAPPSDTADFELDDEIEPVAATAHEAAPLAAEYVETEPVQAEPVHVEPIHVEPEPVAAEIHQPEVHPEPVIHEPEVHTEPAYTEPAYTEPAYTEPLAAEAPVPTPEPVTPPPPFTMPPAAAPAAAASGGLLGGLLSSLYRNKGDKNADRLAADKMIADKLAADKAAADQEAAERAAAKKVAADQLAAEHAAEVAAAEHAAAEAAAQKAADQAAAEAQIAAEKAATEHEAAQRAAAEAERMAAEKAVADQAVVTHTEPVPVLPVPVLGEVMVPEVHIPGTQPAAAAWSGVYLRRDVDLLAMQDAQSQLADVLGENVPAALLVARAAQRHLGLLNLSSVAVASAQGHALDAQLGGDLRSAVTALHGAQPGGHAELLVLDAAALDLDDLHYPHAVTLSLGRVSGGKAALSLNGNVDASQGARFLAEVSALLATPVKLLV